MEIIEDFLKSKELDASNENVLKVVNEVFKVQNNGNNNIGKLNYL
jgi:hypothetical protein